MFIQTEATPNPEVLTFLPGRDDMGEGTRDFRDAEAGHASQLASELFAIEGVTRVFFGPDFLTVGKAETHDWSHLKAPILAAIMDHFTSGKPLFAGSDDAAGGCFAFRAIRWIDGKQTTITGVVLGQPGYDRVEAGLAAAEALVARIAGQPAVPHLRQRALPPLGRRP